MATTIISEGTVVETGERVRRPLVTTLFATADSWPLLISRLGLGLVILPHGLQKMFTVFGGAGYSGTMGYFTSQGIPPVFAFLAIMAEFLGSLGLLTGLLARVAAFGIFCNMLVAAMFVHRPFGFFMNWAGTQAGEGFEFHVLAMALAVSIIVGGAGRYSIDRWIHRRSLVRSGDLAE